MYQTTHLLTIQSNSRAVMELVAQVLREAGLQVIQSFDLQAAKTAHIHCTCPYHGSHLCDCQMIVLLAYNHENKPLTLVAHGKDGKTHIGLLEDPNRGSLSGMEDVIRTAFGLLRLDTIYHPPCSDST